MIIRYRFLLLIHILYCAATIHGILLDGNDAETCNSLCVQCNASAIFANDHCECNFANDSDKVSGAECIQRIQREIQAVELNMLSEDPTDEERNVRSILKYRRRLRPESASYASPTMQGAETYPSVRYPPTLRAMNPVSTYPTSGLYDPMIGGIVHPNGLHHNALIRAITLPGHVLHHVLHPHVYHRPVHHRGIVRSTNPQDRLGIAIVGQPCENHDSSTASNHPTARNNADKPADQNLGLTDPSQYPYITQALYQPMQYQHLPYQYTSYYNPLLNMLQPITNEYVLQPVSPYAQDISDPLTSAANPYSSCGNNAHTEQRSGVLPVDKTAHSNDEKSNDVTRNNNPKEEKKIEKNGIDKS